MKRIIMMLLALCIIFTSAAVMAKEGRQKVQEDNDKTTFTDISSHWSKDVVNKMAGKGLIRGVGNGKFMPDMQMKRSEFVVALHKTLGITMRYIKAPDIKEFFNDVKNEDWYASALYDLAVLNIIDDRGEFRPDSQITREEMVHYIIYGYKYKLEGVMDEIDEGDSNFADDKKIEQRFKKDIKKAVKLGFIMGRGKNMFAPKGITTRAEALVVLDRLISALEKFEDSKKPVPTDKPKDLVKVDPGFKKDGDTYKLLLKITNNSNKEVTINHTSGQKFDFKLLDADKNILYTWSQDKLFIMALMDTVIGAGKSEEFTAELEKENFKDIIENTKYIKAFIVGTSDDMDIDKNGYEIEIK